MGLNKSLSRRLEDPQRAEQKSHKLGSLQFLVRQKLHLAPHL